MTSKDLSIFNSLRPFSIGFDDMFDQFENMLGNGGKRENLQIKKIHLKIIFILQNI